MSLKEEIKILKKIAKARSVPKDKIKSIAAFSRRTRLFLHMCEIIPVEDIKTTKSLFCKKGVFLTSNPTRAALKQDFAIMVNPRPSPALIENVDHIEERNVFVSKASLKFVPIHVYKALIISGGG